MTMTLFRYNILTYDNNVKRSIVHYITDVKKSFEHSFCVIDSLTEKKSKKPSKLYITDCVSSLSTYVKVVPQNYIAHPY